MRATRAVLIGFGLMLAAPSLAQTQQTARIRGQIESVSGDVLTILTRSGAETKVRLTDDARVMAFVPATIADVKQGSYIGVTAMPEPDGSQRALAIHIFPEAMRGVGEGHRPWDLRPNSTMTNAAVDSTVSSVDGQVLVVKYKDGEKTVVVPPNTPIVSYANGDRAELKAGAQVIVMAATRKPDGSLEANRINVGRGVTPPM